VVNQDQKSNVRERRSACESGRAWLRAWVPDLREPSPSDLCPAFHGTGSLFSDLHLALRQGMAAGPQQPKTRVIWERRPINCVALKKNNPQSQVWTSFSCLGCKTLPTPPKAPSDQGLLLPRPLAGTPVSVRDSGPLARQGLPPRSGTLPNVGPRAPATRCRRERRRT